MPTIEFTADRRDKLRKAYEDAIASNREFFSFEDNDYLVAYARYLLEYLDMVLA